MTPSSGRDPVAIRPPAARPSTAGSTRPEPFIQDEDFTLYVGDVLETLEALPDESVHMVVTSPPYWGLRDYGTGSWEGGDSDCDHEKPVTTMNVGFNERWGQGAGERKQEKKSAGQYSQTCAKCGARRLDQQLGLEATPDEFVAKMVEVFQEIRRVLRVDGTCWLNLGDSYTSGNRYYADDRIYLGARGHAARPATPPALKAKELVGIPWRVAFALQEDGWYLRSEIIWCLSGGTRVYARTRKGEMPMSVKDLVRLDPATVQLWSGERWTRVLGWSRSTEPRDGALEIELRSGECVGCTPGHR